MSDTIRVHAVHAIAEGQADGFKELAATMIAKVEAGEPGYLSYELFLSDDESTCHIVGLLEDSEAVMAHLTNMGEMIGRFSELAPATRIGIFGDVSD